MRRAVHGRSVPTRACGVSPRPWALRTDVRSVMRFSAVPLPSGRYCIYVRSSVTEKEKAHFCRFFNFFEECKEAAERIKGRCGLPE